MLVMSLGAAPMLDKTMSEFSVPFKAPNSNARRIFLVLFYHILLLRVKTVVNGHVMIVVWVRLHCTRPH